MRELEAVSASQPGVDSLAAELAASRFECVQLRIVLSSLCEAVESWGQWTMSHELATAHGEAKAVLSRRRRTAEF